MSKRMLETEREVTIERINEKGYQITERNIDYEYIMNIVDIAYDPKRFKMDWSGMEQALVFAQV